MKLKRPLLILAALLGVTIATSLAGKPSAKTKPEKTTVKQTATATKATPKETIPGADVKPAAYFYTGKPYDEDLGGYVFNYRVYSPAMQRWTTTDPSGFPDGVNNWVYAASPTHSLDPTGLLTAYYSKPVTIGGVSFGDHAYIYFKDILDCNSRKVKRGTISGNPFVQGGGGNLTYTPDSDLNSDRNHMQAIDYSQWGYVSEYCLYLDLIGAASAYSGTIPYHASPWLTPRTLDANSNGFIHSILNTLNITVPKNNGDGWDQTFVILYAPLYNNNQNCCE